MSGLSGTNDETIGTENIEKVAGTTGLVGYANTYISLQAVNGIFINGIGSGNSAKAELPFSNEPGRNRHISGLTNGDFWISGQNGGAVIKSCNRSPLGPNREGTGSIHIESANGDVNVYGLNFNNDTKGASNINTVGNSTITTNGDTKAHTWGNVTTIVNGNLHNRTGGTQENLNGGNLMNRVLGAQENINIGDLSQLCVGAQENINLLDLLNLCVGAQENFNIGPVINGNIGHILNLKSFHLEDADAEMKEVKATLHSHKIDISETNCQIRSMLVHLNHAGIHLYD